MSAAVDVQMLTAGAATERKTSVPSLKSLAALFTGPAAPPPWTGVIQWDEFNERMIAVNPPFRMDAETGDLSERDMAVLQLFLEDAGYKVDDAKLRKALLIAAGECAFHPVRDYLDELEVATPDDLREFYNENAPAGRRYFMGDDEHPCIAEKFFGTEGEQAKRESEWIMRWAIAAVRRIRKPGTKADQMLVLVGEQGFRKSSWLAALGGAWFTDQMPSKLAERHADMHLRGKWIVEFPELRHFTQDGNSTETIKAFLSRCVDKYAKMYSSDEVERPRQCVFAGTTNADDCLPEDRTGNRRFLVIHVNKEIEMDVFDRDEFWAAADALEQAGERHWVDSTAEIEATRAAHTSTDPWSDAVEKYLHGCHAKGERYVIASDVLTLALAIPLERQDHKMLARVGGILRQRCGPRKVIKVSGGQGRSSRSAYAVPDFGEVQARVSTAPEFFAGGAVAPVPLSPAAPRASQATG